MGRYAWACSLVVFLSSVGSLAQTPIAVRREVQEFVKTYVDANNRGDATALMDMVTRKPIASSVGMGEITRGWDSIRAEVDKQIGSPHNPKMTLGVIDAEPLGSSHALAVAAFSATLPMEGAQLQVRGAISLVLEKTAGKWKVLHEHMSLELPEEGD